MAVLGRYGNICSIKVPTGKASENSKKLLPGPTVNPGNSSLGGVSIGRGSENALKTPSMMWSCTGKIKPGRCIDIQSGMGGEFKFHMAKSEQQDSTHSEFEYK